MATKKKHTSSSSSEERGGKMTSSSVVEPLLVPLIHDSLTFQVRQTKGLKEMERQAEAEMKRRRRDWEREVERMRDEFLRLHPVSTMEEQRQHHHLDPLVAKRRGSTDILDAKKMHTMITDVTVAGHTPHHHGGGGGGVGSADSDRKLRLRFDVSGFDADTIEVSTDGQRIVVQASKTEMVKGRAVLRQFIRKIQNPIEFDTDKLTSHLMTDGILVVEALIEAVKPPLPQPPLPILPPQSKISESSSTSASPHHHRRRTSSQSTPGTPTHHHQMATAAVAGTSELQGTTAGVGGGGVPVQNEVVKLGVPVFRDERGCRRLFLVVYIGALFQPRDVTVQVIKDNRIVIKARHEEISSERLIKSKFSKEFELTERIEPESVRGGIDGEGKLVVGAFVKGHSKEITTSAAADDGDDDEVEVGVEEFEPKSDLLQCNVLNLSSFPPTMPASAVFVN